MWVVVHQDRPSQVPPQSGQVLGVGPAVTIYSCFSVQPETDLSTWIQCIHEWSRISLSRRGEQDEFCEFADPFQEFLQPGSFKHHDGVGFRSRRPIPHLEPRIVSHAEALHLSFPLQFLEGAGNSISGVGTDQRLVEIQADLDNDSIRIAFVSCIRQHVPRVGFDLSASYAAQTRVEAAFLTVSFPRCSGAGGGRSVDSFRFGSVSILSTSSAAATAALSLLAIQVRAATVARRQAKARSAP